MNCVEFPNSAEQVFGREQIDEAITRMCAELSVALHDQNPVVLTVLNGGLIFASDCLKRFSFPLEIDCIHATRYGDATQGGELEWKSEPLIDLEGRTVLLLDDIFDEGITLASIQEYCLNRKACKVYSAVLVKKNKKRLIEYQPDFFALKERKDQFLFGMGMDYKGYWRNLPAVYTVT
ncbi:MAG: hypoxanthine-guanine phosphoribosyltransferase [Pseudomonadota bacterium]